MRLAAGILLLSVVVWVASQQSCASWCDVQDSESAACSWKSCKDCKPCAGHCASWCAALTDQDKCSWNSCQDCSFCGEGSKECASSGSVREVKALLEDTKDQVKETKEKASVAPEWSVQNMAQMLTDVEPHNLLGFKRAGFIVPSDWECEAGVEGGVWPCPDGIPTLCRFNLHTEGWQAEPDVYACVVHHYCQVPTYKDDVCCKYYNDTSEYPSVTALPPNEVSEKCEPNFQDMWDQIWGYEHWHEDPLLGQDDHPTGRQTHYINFDVNRMELGPTFGVQFYSSNDDTLLVSEDSVDFNPLYSKRYINIKEDLVYEYGDDQADRRRLASKAPPRSKTEHLAAQASKPPEAMTRFAGSCPPSRCPAPQPKKAVPIEVATANARVEPNRRRRLRRGGTLMTSGSFTMASASNRCGNS